jgi:hypothetical protein
MLECMTAQFRQSDLEAYLDEALPVEEMVAIERLLREDRKLVERLTSIHARRNAGVHSVGEIWRTRRLSCCTKEQLGSFLLKTLPEQVADYVAFHIEVIGCRYCQANLADLKARQKEDHDATQRRRRKYFQSSVGHLRRGK